MIQDILWPVGVYFAGAAVLSLVIALTERRPGASLGSAYRDPAPEPKPPPLAVASIRWLRDGDAVITLNDGRTFRGSVTVWHAYPSGEPAHDMAEWLAPRWRAAKWARDDGEGER